MYNELLNIEIIRKSLNNKNIYWTKHCLNRMNQRNILILDVENAINNGKIIEYYYDDYPYTSCLILGKTSNDKIIHVVCGIADNFLYIITAYYPDTEKWEEDMKTRRVK